MRVWIKSVVLGAAFLIPAAAWAAHPLITDDTGTQGRGKSQLEVNGQYDRDEEPAAGTSVRTTGGQANATLSYGIADGIDIVLSVPHQWSTVRQGGLTTSNVNGISDATLEVKRRFFEKDGLSFALKPGVSFPTGNEKKGLGAGRVGYGVFFIATREANPWAFHMNLGYRRNENAVDVDERKDIWHASLAAACEVIENLKVAGNIGIERNPDKGSDRDPAFLLGGFIYSVHDDFDIDFGVKGGLNRAETDRSLLAGIACRF